MPLVSIVTPMHNASAYITNTIQSVLLQTFTDWEMIIVDDLSTDDSVKIVENYLNDPRIKLIQQKVNSGPAVARNVAIDLAQGDYIAFLDSDDIWLPTKLAMQIESLKNNNLGISFSSYYTIDEKGKRTGIRNIPQQVDYYSLLKTNDIGNLTGIYDVRKFGKVFFKNIKHEDYVFWLGLFKSIKTSVSGISEPLAEYRIHSNSVSSNKFKAALWTWNIHRNVEQLSLPKSLFFSSCYVFNALIKRLF